MQNGEQGVLVERGLRAELSFLPGRIDCGRVCRCAVQIILQRFIGVAEIRCKILVESKYTSQNWRLAVDWEVIADAVGVGGAGKLDVDDGAVLVEADAGLGNSKLVDSLIDDLIGLLHSGIGLVMEIADDGGVAGVVGQLVAVGI